MYYGIKQTYDQMLLESVTPVGESIVAFVKAKHKEIENRIEKIFAYSMSAEEVGELDEYNWDVLLKLIDFEQEIPIFTPKMYARVQTEYIKTRGAERVACNKFIRNKIADQIGDIIRTLLEGDEDAGLINRINQLYTLQEFIKTYDTSK